MDTGFGSWAANDTHGLARALSSACVGLRALPANRKPTQMANSPIAFDGLQPLEVHANLTAKVALNDVLAILDRMNNLRELLLSQVFGPCARVNLRLNQDYLGVCRADAVNIA